ncbi:MAG TPA: hypothetical protein VE549_04810 [Myxococcaceae bacterium]|nr:hypothetical protein [Myxococcaceae bacterium]
MSGMAIQFENAQVLCYRIFDIADEIHLERARTRLSADTQRMRLRRAGSEYLQLADPPVTAELGRRALVLSGGEMAVEAMARVFAHGAASIIFRVPIRPGTTLESLASLADELYDSRAVDALALETVQQLRHDLGDALEGDHLWEQSESYTIVFAQEIRGRPSASALLEHVDLARLLLGERGDIALSPQERAEVLQTSFSYTAEDLAVIDWNGAFVYEPSGSMDIPDVLEIVNAQLLELRYYDDLLDRSIKSVYDGGLLVHQPAFLRIVRSPYRRLARRVLVTLLEMSEFIERVENSLKVIGDFYLARVYEGAVRRLRIRQWQASVTRKQQMLGQVYGLLKGEVDIDRSLTLETMIVVLIVLEMLLALVRIGH